MRSSELVLSTGGFLFDCCLFCCCTISGITLFPRALPNIKLLITIVGTGELICDEYSFCRDDGKRRISDGVVGPLGFGLGILVFVDVLGDYLAFKMVTLNIVLQCEDIMGMKSTTRRLELGDKFTVPTKV